mmetsp:Transcript_44187/g.32163  ORF Transcript_44187/g.32163 Transcript_44187/m.32163 type:complete len:123 (-) Transcript_44187:42-410(-)
MDNVCQSSCAIEYGTNTTYPDFCFCSEGGDCQSSFCVNNVCESSCFANYQELNYPDGCFCTMNEECESGKCEDNACQSTFPWWGYLIIAAGVCLIIAGVAIAVCFKKKPTEQPYQNMNLVIQ